MESIQEKQGLLWCHTHDETKLQNRLGMFIYVAHAISQSNEIVRLQRAEFESGEKARVLPLVQFMLVEQRFIAHVIAIILANHLAKILV